MWSPYKPYWLYQQHLAGTDAPEGGAAQAKAQLEDWVKWHWVTIEGAEKECVRGALN